MKTTHTPNLDNLDPVAREILGDVLTGLFRIHPVTPPVAPTDDDERDAYAANDLRAAYREKQRDDAREVWAEMTADVRAHEAGE